MLGKRKSNQGMSYIEVIICLMIVSVLVLPLSASFVSSVKIREEGVSLNQSTFYAESLLEEVKEQLHADLLEAERIAQDPLSITLPAHYPVADRTSPHHLHMLLHKTATPNLYVKNKYATERYSYEVAIWPLKEAINNGGGKIDFDDVGDAIKFYTDRTYLFNGTEPVEQLPHFKVDGNSKEILLDDLFTKATSLTGTNLSVYKGVNTLKLNQGNPIDPPTLVTRGNLSIETIKAKVPGSDVDLIGYLCTINGPATTGANLLIVDMRSLNLTSMPRTLLKFHNKGRIPLIIKLLAKEEDLEVTAGNLCKVDEKVDMVIVDEEIDSKTTIEKTSHISKKNDYLIAIIVRNKNPQFGEDGKIVKTMMELYSFESME